MSEKTKIAIACQGGGSHTAFTAGVLKRLLGRKDDYEISGFSGASGGAICALLAWYGLLTGGSERASELLDSFWRENSASEYWDMISNGLFVESSRLQGLVAIPEVSPYLYPSLAKNRLRRMLEDHVDFEEMAKLAVPSNPSLLVSAVEVRSGEFRIFHGAEVSVEAILASTAVPNLFRAVRINGGLYWDGLFSQNPPIREFLRGKVEQKPDEIWVVQINPQRRASEPTSMLDILDRRNELAGNLSLNQEVHAIETINDLLPHLPKDRYKRVRVRRIEMTRNLDAASKLDRSPSFIKEMMAYGEEAAKGFLEVF
ncbi:MAG: patatin-like phospholipase family protein [Rubrobacteraceae bacterium]